MTYITTRDDETNHNWFFEGPVDVLLDGKRVFGCFEADDDAGFIVKAVRDDDGNIKVTEDGDIVTEKLFGKVNLVGVIRSNPLGQAMKIWCFEDAHFWGQNLAEAATKRGHEAVLFDDPRKPDAGYVFMHMHHHPMVRTYHKRVMATLALNPDLKLIPDYRSSVLYDDKLEQSRQLSKWLPRTRVFYSKSPAWDWLENSAKFPFISKSSEGSASNNVRMIKTLDDARDEIRLAFSSFGIKCHYGLIQRGYLLWQDFLPDNQFDVRIVAIGNKRMMMVRDNREDRPMASGSGRIHPIRSLEDQSANSEVMNALAKAEVFFRAERFKWCGIDMVFDNQNNKWLIIEVTVGWTMHSYGECEFIENFKPTGRKGSDVWNVLLDEIEKGTFE